MKLKKFLKRNKSYKRNRKRRKFKLKDFIWVDIDKLNFPWRPICELTENNKNREMCTILPTLMKDEKGVFNTLIKYWMHLEILDLYEKYGESLFENDRWKETRYYLLHKFYRENGIDNQMRTDSWIFTKIKRLIILFNNIKNDGYRYGRATYLSVLDKPIASYYGYKREIDGYEIWGGVHRATCLYKLGYKKVKALLLKPQKIR